MFQARRVPARGNDWTGMRRLMGASTERVPNGLTAIRIESRVRLGPVSPDPSLSLMP
jgi:hypothetical protein